MGTLGWILVAVGGIALLIFWIMAIIKCFKAGDTLWGVLTIFLGIPGLIWFFMKGHKKLGIYWIIALVVYLVGYAMAIVPMMQEAMKQMPVQ